jgi:hypothetical protein
MNYPTSQKVIKMLEHITSVSENSYSKEELVFQYENAQELITQIKSDIDTLDELDTTLLLDLLGVIGVQLIKGSAASAAYLDSLASDSLIFESTNE